MTTLTFKGTVVNGRGLASEHLHVHRSVLNGALGESVAPGSLNIALDRPLRLDDACATALDPDARRKVWKGRMMGRQVLFYRWSDCPLSIIEVISDVHLRSALSLRNGSRVAIEVEREVVVRVGPYAHAGWLLIWWRRSALYYNDIYANLVVSLQRHFGLNQTGQRMSIIDLTRRFARALAARFVLRPPQDTSPERYRRSTLSPEQDPLIRVRNLLTYTKASGSAYAANAYPAGYHSVTIGGETIPGQRKPSARLSALPFGLEGATVLDIGCNQGGMLFEAARRGIRWGVGIDYDARMVNAANKIRQYDAAYNLHFFSFDLEREDLAIIEDFLPPEPVDIVFLLSVCMWIDNWRRVIDACAAIAPCMLFESNGSEAQQAEQAIHLRRRYSSVLILSENSDDDASQKNRKLYFCKR